MRWCFEDDSSYALTILGRLRSGRIAAVPMLWLYEVISVTALSQQRGFLSAERAGAFLDDLRSLRFEVDAESDKEHAFRDARGLALEHRLSGYDAIYLELAIRKHLPLASLDRDMNNAAVKAGVQLVRP